MKQHLSCLQSMATTKQWLPDHEPEPAAEILSGDLYLLTATTTTSTCKKRGTRYPVHVKVYRSCFGHYAVVSASLRAPSTFLNLRTCNARLCLSGSDSADTRLKRFRVEMGGGEGQVIYFEVNPRDSVCVEEWVRAFQGTVVTSTPGNISPLSVPSSLAVPSCPRCRRA